MQLIELHGECPLGATFGMTYLHLLRWDNVEDKIPDADNLVPPYIKWVLGQEYALGLGFKGRN